MLPPLTSDVRIEVASGGLENHLCAVLAEIEDENLAALVDGCCIVSAEVEQLLLPLCNLEGTEWDCIGPTPLLPSDLFAKLAERWDHYLTPERLHALRPLDGGRAWNFATYDPQGVTWRGVLKARAAEGSLRSLRNLLLRDNLGLSDHTEADGKDELLRAAFAPDDAGSRSGVHRTQRRLAGVPVASGAASRRRRNDGGVVRGSFRGPPPCGDPLPAVRRARIKRAAASCSNRRSTALASRVR